MKLRTALSLVTGLGLYAGTIAAWRPHDGVQYLMAGIFCGMFASMFWDRSNSGHS